MFCVWLLRWTYTNIVQIMRKIFMLKQQSIVLIYLVCCIVSATIVSNLVFHAVTVNINVDHIFISEWIVFIHGHKNSFRQCLPS